MPAALTADVTGNVGLGSAPCLYLLLASLPPSVLNPVGLIMIFFSLILLPIGESHIHIYILFFQFFSQFIHTKKNPQLFLMFSLSYGTQTKI